MLSERGSERGKVTGALCSQGGSALPCLGSPCPQPAQAPLPNVCCHPSVQRRASATAGLGRDGVQGRRSPLRGTPCLLALCDGGGGHDSARPVPTQRPLPDPLGYHLLTPVPPFAPLGDSVHLRGSRRERVLSCPGGPEAPQPAHSEGPGVPGVPSLTAFGRVLVSRAQPGMGQLPTRLPQLPVLSGRGGEPDVEDRMHTRSVGAPRACPAEAAPT